MSYATDRANSRAPCRTFDTSAPRGRRTISSTPIEDLAEHANPHRLRLSWLDTPTSCRVHDMTLRGHARPASFGGETARKYDICTPPAPDVTNANSAKSRRSSDGSGEPGNTRLTASAAGRSNRPSPTGCGGRGETSPRACGERVETAGARLGKNGGFFLPGALVPRDRKSSLGLGRPLGRRRRA